MFKKIKRWFSATAFKCGEEFSCPCCGAIVKLIKWDGTSASRAWIVVKGGKTYDE